MSLPALQRYHKVFLPIRTVTYKYKFLKKDLKESTAKQLMTKVPLLPERVFQEFLCMEKTFKKLNNLTVFLINLPQKTQENSSGLETVFPCQILQKVFAETMAEDRSLNFPCVLELCAQLHWVQENAPGKCDRKI